VANEAGGTATVGVTRKLWDVTVVASTRVVGAPALDGNNVYVSMGVAGNFSANVFALGRATGLKTWEAAVAGTPTTPVTLSPPHPNAHNRVYVGSDNKMLHSF